MYYDGWMLPSILQGPLGTVQVTKYFGEGGGGYFSALAAQHERFLRKMTAKDLSWSRRTSS